MKVSESGYPKLWHRLYSVWFRHFRVYTKHLISNGLPPFLEPVIFLLGIGFGLGAYVQRMDGLPYLVFLATALPVTSAMFTASYECTFGTFVRLEFDKAYDGMLSAPITLRDVFIGELLWAGTKGFFFSACVVCVMLGFGALPWPGSLLVPLLGFLTGTAFGAISLFVTSFVKNINHFNFYFTGFLSPMFFFSGTVFPISSLPPAARAIAEVVPLTHAVRLARSVALGRLDLTSLFDLGILIAATLIAGHFATERLRRRLVL